MTRLLGALRSALGPTDGTPLQRDPAVVCLAARLRGRRPRGAAEWARFMEDAQRALRAGEHVPPPGPERLLDAYDVEQSPRGTPCIPPLLACP